MGFNKGHMEFTTLNLTEGFHDVPGYPPGFSERIIAGSLDEKTKTGNRTRILRIEPGAFSTVPFVHDYWEEFLITGDLIVVRMQTERAENSSKVPHIACGPLGSITGHSHRRRAAIYSRHITPPRSER